MAIYEIFLWLLSYGLLLLFTALIINGVHITTRGEKETLPDGTEGKINDMIFYPFLELITAKKGMKRIYYKGDELKKLQRSITKKMPLPQADQVFEDHLRFNNGRGADALKLWNENAKDYLDDQEIHLDLMLVTEPEVNAQIRFYKEYPIYYLPKYLRKPILECIKCMASVWGTLIFWPVVLHFFPFDWLMFPIWAGFCFSLSYVNTFLYQKAH